MRRLTVFFLLSSVLCVFLSFPAFSAQDKKDLSEEEEIALMMEQLEQFQNSWAEDGKEAADARLPSQPSEKAVSPESKPVLTGPLPVPVQAIPSIKITTAQTPSLAGTAQIKTQDGRILDTTSLITGPAGSAQAKVPPAIAPPAIKKQSASIKVSPQQDPAAAKSSLTESAMIAPAASSPAQEMKKKDSLVAQPVSEVKPDLAVRQETLEKKLAEAEAALLNQNPVKEKTAPAKAAEKSISESVKQTEAKEGVDPELLKKLNLPQKSASAVSPQGLKQTEAPLNAEIKPVEIKKIPAPTASAPRPAEEGLKEAVPPVPEEPQEFPVKGPEVSAANIRAVPVKVEKTEEAAAPPREDDIIIVQDESAQYRAAREKESLRSEREVRVVDSDEAKKLGRRPGVALPADARSAARSKWAAARKGGPVKKEPPKPNLFAETFYLSPAQRLAYDVYDIDGFIFIKSPNPDLNTKYAVVTGFGGGAMKTRAIPNLQTLGDAKKWVSDHLETKDFETVEIKRMKLGKDENAKELYWVGQKAFADLKTAQAEVAVIQSIVTAQGGDFTKLVAESSAYAPMTDATAGAEIKGPANFEREEELMLKYLDQMDIGNKLFGPFQGDASGESFTWQSFGETTWRRTNLDRTDYRSQVGYWTNRVVFKGIRFPMNTVEPFLESTVSLDSTSADFSSNMKLFAGLEWRPFARNPWLYNYRPWGGINMLEWIKNFRFYVMYGERKAIKDPIEGSADTDLLAGVQIFYEWGVELPPLDQKEPKAFSEFVERYFWGEYFGDYRHEMTNFGAEDDYNSWLGNSSITLGVKLPGIPLPDNPINEELMLMPYMRFEHVNSAEFSFPYQNQYFVAAGMRWMPWRNYRFKENEWLSKAKFFGEYVGVGLSQHAKQDGEAPNAVRWDLRFGVSFSSRRY